VLPCSPLESLQTETDDMFLKRIRLDIAPLNSSASSIFTSDTSNDCSYYQEWACLSSANDQPTLPQFDLWNSTMPTNVPQCPSNDWDALFEIPGANMLEMGQHVLGQETPTISWSGDDSLFTSIDTSPEWMASRSQASEASQGLLPAENSGDHYQTLPFSPLLSLPSGLFKNVDESLLIQSFDDSGNSKDTLSSRPRSPDTSIYPYANSPQADFNSASGYTGAAIGEEHDEEGEEFAELVEAEFQASLVQFDANIDSETVSYMLSALPN
jgi:hypothetical protein